MAEFVLVAQFNQSQGALLQIQYPYALTSDESDLDRNIADYMIPEGLHARTEDSTLFLVRRQGQAHPEPRTSIDMHPEYSSISFSKLIRVKHQVDVLLFDQKHHGHSYAEWAQFSVGDGKGCALSLVKATEFLWVIDLKQFSSTILSMYPSFRPIHADLQYTALDQNFASVYTEDGHAVGFHFLSSTQEQLEQLLTFGKEDTHLSTEEDSDSSGRLVPSLLYCLSTARTKHDASAERGAITLAFAVCSSSLHVYQFHVSSTQELLHLATAHALDGRDSLEDLARELYHTINQINLRTLPSYSAAERRVYRYLAEQY